MRDEALSKRQVNFLNQAFRYRGKANYRDSIFLSYGDDNSKHVETLCSDLLKVSKVFQKMTACYVSMRIERGLWGEYLLDVDSNKRLSGKIEYLKF